MRCDSAATSMSPTVAAGIEGDGSGLMRLQALEGNGR